MRRFNNVFDQNVKPDRSAHARLHAPLVLPLEALQEITMYFVSGFPKVRGLMESLLWSTASPKWPTSFLVPEKDSQLTTVQLYS